MTKPVAHWYSLIKKISQIQPVLLRTCSEPVCAAGGMFFPFLMSGGDPFLMWSLVQYSSKQPKMSRCSNKLYHLVSSFKITFKHLDSEWGPRVTIDEAEVCSTPQQLEKAQEVDYFSNIQYIYIIWIKCLPSQNSKRLETKLKYLILGLHTAQYLHGFGWNCAM